MSLLAADRDIQRVFDRLAVRRRLRRGLVRHHEGAGRAGERVRVVDHAVDAPAEDCRWKWGGYLVIYLSLIFKSKSKTK